MSPIVNLKSTRGQILLWVATEPRGSWSSSSIIDELDQMGIPRKTSIDAIGALRQRALLHPGSRLNGEGDILRATAAGHRAIRGSMPVAS